MTNTVALIDDISSLFSLSSLRPEIEQTVEEKTSSFWITEQFS